jgi:hypothetical protein
MHSQQGVHIAGMDGSSLTSGGALSHQKKLHHVGSHWAE